MLFNFSYILNSIIVYRALTIRLYHSVSVFLRLTLSVAGAAVHFRCGSESRWMYQSVFFPLQSTQQPLAVAQSCCGYFCLTPPVCEHLSRLRSDHSPAPRRQCLRRVTKRPSPQKCRLAMVAQPRHPLEVSREVSWLFSFWFPGVLVTFTMFVCVSWHWSFHCCDSLCPFSLGLLLIHSDLEKVSVLLDTNLASILWLQISPPPLWLLF